MKKPAHNSNGTSTMQDGGAFSNRDTSESKCMDLIMGEELDINTYVSENIDNIVFKSPGSTSYMCASRSELKGLVSDPANIVMTCTHTSRALNITPDMLCGLKMAKVSSIGIGYGGFVTLKNLDDVVFNTEDSIFEIEEYPEKLSVTAIASLQLMPEHRPDYIFVPFYMEYEETLDSYVRRLDEWGAENNRPNLGQRWEDYSNQLLGAAHCQSGYEGQKIYRVVGASNLEYNENPRVWEAMVNKGCVRMMAPPFIPNTVPDVERDPRYFYDDREIADNVPVRNLGRLFDTMAADTERREEAAVAAAEEASVAGEAEEEAEETDWEEAEEDAAEAEMEAAEAEMEGVAEEVAEPQAYMQGDLDDAYSDDESVVSQPQNNLTKDEAEMNSIVDSVVDVSVSRALKELIQQRATESGIGSAIGNNKFYIADKSEDGINPMGVACLEGFNQGVSYALGTLSKKDSTTDNEYYVEIIVRGIGKAKPYIVNEYEVSDSIITYDYSESTPAIKDFFRKLAGFARGAQQDFRDVEEDAEEYDTEIKFKDIMVVLGQYKDYPGSVNIVAAKASELSGLISRMNATEWSGYYKTMIEKRVGNRDRRPNVGPSLYNYHIYLESADSPTGGDTTYIEKMRPSNPWGSTDTGNGRPPPSGEVISGTLVTLFNLYETNPIQRDTSHPWAMRGGRRSKGSRRKHHRSAHASATKHTRRHRK